MQSKDMDRPPSKRRRINMDSFTTQQVSSFSTHSWTYDVFLSFRGKDTRYTFTDHLHNNLDQKGINTFIDDELTRGEEISQELFRAIEGSRISLIVVSENYASSKWCLDELVHILECKRSMQQKVRPVFYKVDPSDVRHQRGSFGDALANHESNLKGNMERVTKWRAALTETANLSGWHFSDGDFAQLKEPAYLDLPKCQVGLNSRVQDILERLDVRGIDISMIGICGTGGIGKTTIAKAVYNTIAHKFEGSYFLANVREESEVHGGLLNLQNILLSKIVGGKELKAINVDKGITLLRESLRHKRTLLVLDDVNKRDQLKKLAGATDWFGCGSIIIITTRDNHVLHKDNPKYKVRELDPHEACKLFSSKAFKDKTYLDDNGKLSVSTIVEYAQGLPLALEILGSCLCYRPIHQWQSVFDGYRRDPHPYTSMASCIKDVLKISYDELEPKVKEVFLDIACFFKGRKINDVIQILDGCGRINPEHSIQVLEEKAIINVEYGPYGYISMHDLLEEMGKEIVHQESPNEPGERSRLWYHKDVHDVLTKNTGTSKIEGIMVKLPMTNEMCLSPKCFKKMKNLKNFINVNARFCGNVDHLPEQLSLLDWAEYPLQSLPSNFNMEQLVQLNMPHSRIARLGEKFKRLQNLKSLNFRGCKFLTEIPNLSGCLNLERVDLWGCTSLVEVHPSVGFLEKLVHLNLEDCSNLVKLPRKVNWRSLRHLNLEFCSSLESFPEIVGEMKCLTGLSLAGCSAIKELPSSIGYLINLELLDLSNCENLTNLPGKFICLRVLHLGGCRNLVEIPQLSPCIEYLDVRDCVSLERISKLSKILEGEESQMIEEMYLTNCWRLIENLVKEANVLVNDDYQAAEALFPLFLSCQQSKFKIAFPGSKIPKWFSCQMEIQGFRLFECSIEILPNFKWENTGLAMCVIGGVSFDVSMHINKVEVLHVPTQHVDSEGSDHVWLQYISFHEMWRLGYMRPLPPFMCQVLISTWGHCMESFKSCGVHLLMPSNEDVCMKIYQVQGTSRPGKDIYKDDEE